MNYSMLGSLSIDPSTGTAVHPATMRPPEKTPIQEMLERNQSGQYMAIPQDMRKGYHRDTTTGEWAPDYPDPNRTAAQPQAQAASVSAPEKKSNLLPLAIAGTVAVMAFS